MVARVDSHDRNTPRWSAGEVMEQKSRSQIKREMLALQKLGEQLVDLSPTQLNQLGLPAELLEAVIGAQAIKSRGARRRQMQFIGALMRKIDPEPIARLIADLGRKQAHEMRSFHHVERWRDRLLDGDDDLVEELLGQFPGLDRSHLRQLVRNARKEFTEEKPPRSARALFRYLRDEVAK